MIEREREREKGRGRERERHRERERDAHARNLSSLLQLVPEDEPTPEQKQQQIVHLLHSLISSPSSATPQPAPTIPPLSSAPVYSTGGAAQQTGSAPLHAPVLTSPPPPTAGGGGNAPVAHVYGHPPSNARVIVIKFCLMYQLG